MKKRIERINQSTVFLSQQRSMLFLILIVLLRKTLPIAEEDRYYCMGRVGEGILTVRFTYRANIIRIYGAGYWRKGRKIYEEQNKIY